MCMHKNLVHAQESRAFTRILCMHKNLVHAQDACACTAIASKICVFCQNTLFHEWAPYGRWGGHRTAKTWVVAMRVFLYSFYDFPKINSFRACGRFMIFRPFVKIFDKGVFSRKWPRSVWECSGGIPDLSGPIFEPFWRKSPKTSLLYKSL